MLRELDLERIAKVLRAKGHSHFEIYAELTQRTVLTHFDRTESARTLQTGGLALRTFQGNESYHFETTHLSTAGVLAALAGKMPPPSEAAKKEVTPRAARPSHKGVTVSEFYRSLQSPALVIAPTLTVEEETRRFEYFCTEMSEPQAGRDEQASLLLQWRAPGGREPQRITWYRRSLEGLLQDLARHPLLRQEVARSLAPPTRWPMPQGELDTVWSASAFAKLCLPLVRQCEADRRWYGEETDLENLLLPDWFSLSDVPESEQAVDFQGIRRHRTPLIEKGLPARLACDRSSARELRCAPTGHARRESYHSAASIGVWNAELEGPRVEKPLLDRLGNGLYIEDIELLGWLPQSGSCRVRLKEGRLVHQGELGEYLEPTTVDLPLPRLLHSCAALGASAQRTGFRIAKSQGRHLTEITTPDALTASIPFSGSVPASHYW